MGDLYISFLTNSPYGSEYGVGPALKSSNGSPEKFVQMMGGYSDTEQKDLIILKLNKWQKLFEKYKNNKLNLGFKRD
jgi:hypothetical protein